LQLLATAMPEAADAGKPSFLGAKIATASWLRSDVGWTRRLGGHWSYCWYISPSSVI
jgi:hypothetical protein